MFYVYIIPDVSFVHPFAVHVDKRQEYSAGSVRQCLIAGAVVVATIVIVAVQHGRNSRLLGLLLL